MRESALVVGAPATTSSEWKFEKSFQLLFKTARHPLFGNFGKINAADAAAAPYLCAY